MTASPWARALSSGLVFDFQSWVGDVSEGSSPPTQLMVASILMTLALGVTCCSVKEVWLPQGSWAISWYPFLIYMCTPAHTSICHGCPFFLMILVPPKFLYEDKGQ